jgi:hypothetical protein
MVFHIFAASCCSNNKQKLVGIHKSSYGHYCGSGVSEKRWCPVLIECIPDDILEFT